MREAFLAAIPTVALLLSLTAVAQSPNPTSPAAPGSPEVSTPGTSGPAQPSPPPNQPTERTRQIQVSSIIENDLITPNGAELGKIEQVVEHQADKEMYLVVSNGGVMGFFDDQVVVPVNRIAVRNDRIVASDLTEETFKSLPDFDEASYQAVGVGKTVTIAEMK